MILPHGLRRAATALGFGMLAAGVGALSLVQLGQALRLPDTALDLWWRLDAPGTYALAVGAAILVVFALTFNLAPGTSGWVLAGVGLLVSAGLAARALDSSDLAAALVGAGLFCSLWPSPPARIIALAALAAGLFLQFEVPGLDPTTAIGIGLVPALGLALAFALSAWTGARAAPARRTL